MKHEHHFAHRIGWLRAAVLGAVSGRAGGASAVTGATRVVVWGAVAMAVTAGIGTVVGTVV